MPTTSKGAATRRRIIDTAWELSDTCEVPLLGGVSLRDVAHAAQLSPTAVTYHFPTMRELADAMVEQLCTSTWPLVAEAIDVVLDQAADQGLAAVTRLAANTNWAMLTTDEELVVQRRLSRCYASTEGHDRIRTLLAGLHRAWVDDMTLLYERTIERLDLQVVEPLTTNELALSLSAMAEALQLRSMIDPDAVRPDLFGDVAVALVSSVLAPAARPVTLDEVAIEFRRPDGERDGDDRAALIAAAELLAPLFVDGVEATTLTSVGRVIGCGPAEVAELYGSLRRIAALSFRRHLDDVEAAARRRRDAGPHVALADAVYEMARHTLDDRHCALALVHERQDGAGRAGRWDLHAAVPLARAVAEPLGELLGGPSQRAADLADLIVDTTLSAGATRPRATPAELTELVIRLAPGGR